MKNIESFAVRSLALAALFGVVLAAGGCGSDSAASISFPRTPTPVGLRQVATPVPTATALPSS